MKNSSFNVPTGSANKNGQNAFPAASSSGNPTTHPTQIGSADTASTAVQHAASDNPLAVSSVVNIGLLTSPEGSSELPKFIPRIDPHLQNHEARTEPDTLEAFLFVVFLALNTPSPDASKEVHDAFEQLTKILRRYIALMLASRHIPNAWVLAEDIVQEFWLRLLTRDLARRFDEQQFSLRAPYLFGILRRVISEAIRRLKLGRIEPLAMDMPDFSPDAAEATEMRELQADVNAAISRLRPTLAAAILQRYWPDAGLPANNDRSTSTKYVHTFRAKQQLRADLESRYGLSE